MSAPNNKTDGKLTERQLAEQKEAKQLKLYTSIFAAVLALCVVFAVYSGVNSKITSSGMREKSTVAAVVGDHKISNAEMSYFFLDAVNNFTNTYGSYISLFGLDTGAALDAQVYDESTGSTWADNFMDQAVENARVTYAVADAAKAAGHKLTAEEEAGVEGLSNSLDTYATLYNYKDADSFLKAQYGNGASRESYLDHYRLQLLANSYQNAARDALTYTDEQIEAKFAESPMSYTTYLYNQYTMNASSFLEGGTADENGSMTYTDEEKAAANEKLAAAAAELEAAEIADAETLDAALAGVIPGAVSAANSYMGTSVPSAVRDWVLDAARQAGDHAVLPASAADDGSVSTYYVVCFNGTNANDTELVNVRHILLSYDADADGAVSDEAKAACKAEAEAVLAEWENGAKTEDSFAELANTRSTDSGSNTNGGLYENVYPGQMVSAFNDWCFDAARAAGDTGIVETEYGCHVMYFVGGTGTSYRNYLITNDMTSADMETWYNGIVDPVTAVKQDTSLINTGIKLSR